MYNFSIDKEDHFHRRITSFIIFSLEIYDY